MKSDAAKLYKTTSPKPIYQVALFALVMVLSSGKVILAEIYSRILSDFSDVKVNLMLWALCIIFLYGISLFLYVYFRQILVLKVSHVIQHSTLDSYIKQNVIVWEKRGLGKWHTLIAKDPRILSGFYSSTLLPLTLGLLEYICALIYGFSKSVPLTLTIVFLSLFSWIIPRISSHKVFNSQESKQLEDEAVRMSILDSVSGHMVIRSFKSEKFFVNKFYDNCERYAEASIKTAAETSKMEALNIGVGFLSNTLWMVVGIVLINNNHLMIGEFLGFMAICNSFNWPFFELSNLVANYSKQKVSFKRINEEKHVVDTLGLAKKEHISEINAIDISFKYPESNSYIIDGFSYEFNKNCSYSISGESGCGKTTLLKMLLGLYPPDDGVIQIDRSCTAYNMDLYANVSYVPQGNSLFSGTIYENILLGRLDATSEEIYSAAKKAFAHEFITHLPMGYDTVIGDGAELQLSEGQAQRIALARAFLKDADFNFLDEITSALDPQNEDYVLESVLNHMSGVIMVAHRPKAINACEKKIHMGGSV